MGSAEGEGDSGVTTDWPALERSPDFQRLVAERRRFVVPALVVFVVWFGGFLLLTGYARDLLAKTPIGSISWAYLLALSLIVMTWTIAWLYLRWADRNLSPLAERVADAAGDGEGGQEPAPSADSETRPR